MATTANRTGALSRDTPVPELNLPVRTPFARTPLAVARKLVIFAVIESRDGVARLALGFALALADGATTAATARAERAAVTCLRIVSSLLDEIDAPPAQPLLPGTPLFNSH
ncbi:MAG TPA: hypothetical protein VGH93_11380 [Solirubrobacteraceae bacterium]